MGLQVFSGLDDLTGVVSSARGWIDQTRTPSDPTSALELPALTPNSTADERLLVLLLASALKRKTSKGEKILANFIHAAYTKKHLLKVRSLCFRTLASFLTCFYPRVTGVLPNINLSTL